MHATAEQVYEHVFKKHPTISRATVFRNLGQMSDAGELLKIGSFYGSVHYDHKCHNHYHFVCDACKWVYDISACGHDINSELADMDGFEVKGYHLSFNGLCRNCKSKRDDGAC